MKMRTERKTELQKELDVMFKDAEEAALTVEAM